MSGSANQFRSCIRFVIRPFGDTVIHGGGDLVL
jgi:hypothetical protein